MKANKIIFVILLTVLSISFFGCSGSVPAVVQGYRLSVDSDGQFSENIVYKSGTSTWEFNKDGSYELKTLDSSGSIISGRQGTYSWNHTSFELSMIISKYYYTDGSYWRSYSTMPTSTMLYYFTSQGFGAVYKLSDTTKNSFTHTSESVDENGVISTLTTTLVFSDTTIATTNVMKTTDSGGTQTGGSEVEGLATINDKYPGDVAWKKGETVTFSLTETSGRSKSWDATNNVLGSWVTSTTFSKYLATYANMGSYIMDRSGSNWIPLR